MKPMWTCIDNILTKENCNKIIEFHKPYLDRSKIVSKQSNFFKILKRKSQVTWILSEHITYPIISDIMYLIKNVAREVHNVDINYFEPVQFAKYGFLDHYGKHRDVIPENPHRLISASIELSDPEDYIGGNLWINSDGEKYPLKKQGSLIVFPSILEHKVTPVFYGTRYSLVFWAKQINQNL